MSDTLLRYFMSHCCRKPVKGKFHGVAGGNAWAMCQGCKRDCVVVLHGTYVTVKFIEEPTPKSGTETKEKA